MSDEYSNLLASIHNAMQSDPGYKFIDPADGEALTARGFVEVNPTIVDDDGDVAARLTPSGIWEVENGKESELAKNSETTAPAVDEAVVTDTATAVEPATEPASGNDDPVATEPEPVTAQPEAVTGEITITKGGFVAPVKASKSKGPRKPKYPFDQLEIGDSFLIPGKTRKDLSATLANANKANMQETAETETYKHKGVEKTRNKRVSLKRFVSVQEDGGVRIGRVDIAA